LTLALAAMPALAHKLKVYAFADGARIEGSAYFAGGGKAGGTRIIVQDAQGRTLAELTPAADGSFAFEAKGPDDHLIVAESADGHRAEWRVSASELAGGFPARERGGESAPATAPETAPPPPDSTPSARATAGTGTVLDAALESAIERAVARQVRPLREELIAAQDALRIQDLLGGLGYIFGLAGLALWWHGRRTGDRR
jgi:nickel transport protein